MILHQNTALFEDAVRFTAEQMNIPPAFIEKDYWVTYALFTIFNHEIGKDTVFKGGTALSKCYNLIERFSEDIDLVILRRDGESDSKLKSKLKTVSAVIEEVLPEEEMAVFDTLKMIKERLNTISWSIEIETEHRISNTEHRISK